MIVAVSTTAIFAVAAAIIVVAILAQYMPRRGRRNRPPRT